MLFPHYTNGFHYVLQMFLKNPKTTSPWTNGFVERFHRTVKEEFFSKAFREKWYGSIGELQKDLYIFIRRLRMRRGVMEDNVQKAGLRYKNFKRLDQETEQRKRGWKGHLKNQRTRRNCPSISTTYIFKSSVLLMHRWKSTHCQGYLTKSLLTHLRNNLGPCENPPDLTEVHMGLNQKNLPSLKGFPLNSTN